MTRITTLKLLTAIVMLFVLSMTVLEAGFIHAQEPSYEVTFDNSNFSKGGTALSNSSYPPNYDFSQGLTKLSSNLVNHDFSQSLDNTGWTVSDATYVQVQTGSLRIEGDNGRFATSPAFTVPADAQSLRFRYFAYEQGNGQGYGFAKVWVQSGTNYTTSLRIDKKLVYGRFIDGWREAVLDIQAFQGQSIKLKEHGLNSALKLFVKSPVI